MVSIFRPDLAGRHRREAKRRANPNGRGFSLDQAIEHMKEAIRLKPNNAEYHYELGRIYLDVPYWAVVRGVDVQFELNQSAELAKAEFQEARKLSPKDLRIYNLLAEAQKFLDGNNEKAIESLELDEDLGKFLLTRLEKRERATKAFSEPDKGKARMHIEQALFYRGLGKYNEAEKQIAQARRHALDWNWLYRMLCELGAQTREQMKSYSQE